MKRVFAVFMLVFCASLSAAPALAWSNTPPAGMTSTCTTTRLDASTVHQQGVLSYADGSAAGGWTVDTMWFANGARTGTGAGATHVVTAADGSWAVTFALNTSASSDVRIFWQQGSKTRMTSVNGSCPIP